jgi:hypothetical protein
MTRAYGGEDAGVVLPCFSLPRYPGASAELTATLHILSICCLMETTGSCLLEHTLSCTTAPLARAAVREILADEVDHARIGWAVLARSGPKLRREVKERLPTLVKGHLDMWLQGEAFQPSPALLAQGLPSSQSVHAVVIGALKEVILPGFAAHGVGAACHPR